MASAKKTNVQGKFVKAREAMLDALIERDREIDLALTGLLAQQHLLLIGCPGCLRGDVLIHDPLNNSTKTVKQRWQEKLPFHVWAWDHNTDKPIITLAEPPWQYPISPMIELTLDNNESFAVTYGHLLFNGVSYVTASEIASSLQQLDAYPLPTIEGTCHVESSSNVRHLKKKVPGSQYDHLSDHHLYDEPLPQVKGNGLTSVPLPTYSYEQLYDDQHMGDLENTNKPFHPSWKYEHPLSKMGCFSQIVPPIGSKSALLPTLSSYKPSGNSYLASELLRKCFAILDRFLANDLILHHSNAMAFASSAIPIFGSSQALPKTYEELQEPHRLHTFWQYLLGVFQTLPILKPLHPTEVNVASYHPQVNSRVTKQQYITKRTVVNAKPVEAEEYYDFHVPRYHNYIAHGVIHHNTAKSLLAESIADWIGCDSLTIHCCKDTTRAAAFGPVRFSALKQDKMDRVLSGGLADVPIAILEEVYKCGPAVLDMFLMIMNERTYREGLVQAKAPLRFLLGLSNEWSPEGCEAALAAFSDRFLLRKAVNPIRSQEGIERLVAIPNGKAGNFDRSHKPKFPSNISLGEIDLAHSEAMAAPFTNEAKEAFFTIRQELLKEGIIPGDRRLKLSVSACQAYAYLAGSDSVTPEHLEVLSHILWIDPVEQPTKAAQVIAKIANPIGMAINDLLMQAEDSLTGDPIESVARLKDIKDKIKVIKSDPRRTVAMARMERLITTNLEKITK